MRRGRNDDILLNAWVGVRGEGAAVAATQKDARRNTIVARLMRIVNNIISSLPAATPSHGRFENFPVASMNFPAVSRTERKIFV